MSDGDDDLLDVPGRTLWHFPQDDSGNHAGSYPANTREAIEQIGRLTAKGASYIVVPQKESWWFDVYEGLEEFFARDDVELDRQPVRRIFAMRQPARISEATTR